MSENESTEKTSEEFINEGNEALSRFDYEEALKAYAAAYELNPKNSAACYKRGMIRYLQNNLDAAEEEWQKGWRAEWQK